MSAAVDPAEAAAGLSGATSSGPASQQGETRDQPVLLNPFLPFSTAKVLSLKATVLLLLTLLIKARVQIVAGSAIGIFLLLLQTLVFLAISGGLVLAAGGAAIYAKQRRRTAAD
ncbi:MULTISPECIES: hypothetical protein [unclassified Cyanobium]|uniref:hypothetical protein n=1 Tax=unclassified Cyanobium TaxID=2627006 RepID=UPI0020CBC4A5|nr:MULTISPECIES: hypothetical protein [unclassified Cyanobium]